jgi:hypothetical protein
MAPMVGTESPPRPWLIHRSSDGVVVGDLRGGFSSPGQAEIGYAIAASEQGHGYASAAVTALVDHAIADPRIEVLIGHASGPSRQRKSAGQSGNPADRGGGRRARRATPARQ